MSEAREASPLPYVSARQRFSTAVRKFFQQLFCSIIGRDLKASISRNTSSAHSGHHNANPRPRRRSQVHRPPRIRRTNRRHDSPKRHRRRNRQNLLLTYDRKTAHGVSNPSSLRSRYHRLCFLGPRNDCQRRRQEEAATSSWGLRAHSCLC